MANPVNLKPLFSLWLLPVLSLSGWLSLMSPRVSAQITPDATLGAESSRIRAVDQVRDLIEGGAIRGGNLFHSFEDFNIGEGQEAYFANPAGIANILSRVTGTDVSNILGTLGVDGTANLFFLNPNGIIFGPNARLDISGSFVASTGDRFTFPDGSSFSAVNPEAPPLLAVNVTPGLQYGTNPGLISNDGNLRVGRDLTLAGGSISNTGSLNAEFGNLTLDAVTGDVDLSGGTLRAGRDTTIRALNSVELTGGDISTDGELFVQGGGAIAFSNSTVFSERDMVFQSPVRRLGNGTTYTTGGYFLTEDLGSNIVDFLVPHDQVIVAEGDVQIDQNYEGQSLYILAGGSVTTAGDVTNITINAGGSGTIIETIDDGTGIQQTVTVNASENPTLDIRAGIDWSQFSDGLSGGADIDGFTLLSDIPTGTAIQLGNDNGAGDFDGVDLTNNNGTVFVSNHYRSNLTLTDEDIQAGSIDTSSSNSFTESINGSLTLQTNGGNITISSQDSINVAGDINSSAETYAYSFSSTSEATGGSVILDAKDTVTTSDINSSAFTQASSYFIGFAEMPIDNIRAIGDGSASSRGGAIDLRAGNDLTTGDLNTLAEANALSFATEGRSTSEPVIVVSGLAGNIDSTAVGGDINLSAGGALTSTEIRASASADSNAQAGVGSFFNAPAISVGGETGDLTTRAIGGNISLEAGDTLTTEDVFSSIRVNAQTNTSASANGFAPIDGRANAGKTGDVSIFALGGDITFLSGNTLTTRDVFSDAYASPSSYANALINDSPDIVTDTLPDIATAGVTGDISATIIGGRINFHSERAVTTGDLTSSTSMIVNSNARASGYSNTVGIAGETGNIDVLGVSGDIALNAEGSVTTGIVSSLIGQVLIDDEGNASADPFLRVSVDVSVDSDTSPEVLRGGEVGKFGDIDVTTTGGNVNLDAGGALRVTEGIYSSVPLVLIVNTLVDDVIPSNSIESGNIVLDTLGGGIYLNSSESLESGNVDSSIDVLVFLPMDEIGSNGDMTATGRAGIIEVNSGDSLLNEAVESFAEVNIFGGHRQRGDASTNAVGGAIALRAENSLITGDLNSSGNADLGVFRDDLDEINASASGGLINLISQTGSVSLDSIPITSNVVFGDGSGGDVQIEGVSVNLVNTNINTSIVGQGDPGNIAIETSGSASLSGSRLVALLESEAEAVRPGGDIFISAKSIELTNFSLLNTTSFGSGNAGNIELHASDSIALIDSSLFSLIAGRGEGGDITLSSEGGIEILDNSVISTAVGFGAEGDGGDIRLRAADQITISGINVIPDDAPRVGTLGPTLDVNDSSLSSFDFPWPLDTPEDRAEKVQDFLDNIDNIQSLNDYFYLDSVASINSDVAFSTEIPYVSVRSGRDIGGRTVDIYKFAVESAGTQFTFDIDNTESQTSPFDMRLDLFDDQLNLLASNNDAPVALGASGSLTRSDPYLTYIFNQPGQYFIRVSEYEQDSLGFGGIGSNRTYHLQVSRLNNFSVNSGISAQTSSTGTAGDIAIDTPRLTIHDGGQIAVSTDGTGSAGNITFTSEHTPNIRVNLQDSIISGTTQSNGRGGSVTISAPESVVIRGNGLITVDTNENGDAGDLGIETGILRIQDGITISAQSNSTARGDAGNIIVDATEGVVLSNDSQLSVETSSRGNAGDITIRTPSLTVASDAAITATATRNAARNSRGGSIFLNASSMDLSGRVGVFSETRGDAPAGNLVLQPYRGDSTLDITLRNVARVSASTRADGDGGNLSIAAPDSINIQGVGERPGRIAVETIGAGDAGTLTIETGNLRIRNGVIISALSGSRPSATGEAGDVYIDVNNLSLSERAEITVRNLNGQAGNINIDANRIFLNAGTISAETGRTAGSGEESANVNLSGLELLLLQNGSLISAEANRRADGGNITIDAEDGFVIGVSGENSDIIATAFRGNGGNIDISTLRIFGMQERSGTRDELRSNTTNDISASSQFGTDGAIAIEDLGIDPVQGVTELPTDTEAPPLSQGCQPGIDGQGRFINTEQGGIPTNPSDPISSSGGWEDVQPANAEENELQDSQLPDEIIEAEGWQVNGQGQVVLHANMTESSTVFDCQLQ